MPQYEGLALKDIYAILDDSHPHVYDYLPDQQELPKVPKEWVCNVIASVVKEPFLRWIKAVVEARNKAISKKLDDEMD